MSGEQASREHVWLEVRARLIQDGKVLESDTGIAEAVDRMTIGPDEVGVATRRLPGIVRQAPL